MVERCEAAWEQIAAAAPDLIMICPNVVAIYIGGKRGEYEFGRALMQKATELDAGIMLFDTDDEHSARGLRIEPSTDGRQLALQWAWGTELCRWEARRNQQ